MILLFFRRRAWLLLSLLPLGAAGQQAAPAAATDVIVRTDGQEIPARVLLVAPDRLRYFSLTDPTRPGTDTLSVARSDVFMVRYANGTKDVLLPAAPAMGQAEPTGLIGLTARQRYDLGASDARKYFQPSKSVFWGSFGVTCTTGILGGVASVAVFGSTPPKREPLLAKAHQPELLSDTHYYQGYRKQAQRRKLGKAAAGAGVGLGAQVVLYTVILGVLFSQL